VTIGGVYGNEALFIAPKLNSPIWNNKLVRQALAYGIDYAHLLQTGYVGQSRKWDRALSHGSKPQREMEISVPSITGIIR
jgi:ABC-type transport system substrate-binding protein